jgi:copper transport protein
VKRWCAAVIAIAGVLVPAAPVAAHAGLDSSTPSASSVLEEAPGSIVLDFDEPVEATLATIEVFDQDRALVEVGPPEAVGSDASIVTVDLPDLGDGVYVVVWRVTSVDGHVVDGAFSFQIGTDSDVDAEALLAALGQGASASAGVERTLSIARLLAYVGLVLVLGAMLWAGMATDRLASAGSTRGVLWSGATLFAVGSLVQFGAQAAYVIAGSVGDMFDASAWGRIDQTSTGRALLVRIVLAVVLVVLVAQWRHRATAWWRSVAVAVAIGALVSFPAGGHAAALTPRALWTSVDAVHLAAVVVWLGGLLLFTVGASTWLRGDEAAPVVRRFSTASAVAVPVLVVTGLAQANRLSGGLGNLTDTTWGRTLLAKVSVVVVLVAVAGVSRWLLSNSGSGSIRRTVAAEAVLGIAVLALSAGLVGESPQPRSERQVFSTTLAMAGVIIDVTVTPGGVGQNEMHVIVTPPGGSLRPVTGVTARVSLPEQEIPDAPVELVADGTNHYTGVVGFALPGVWVLELIVEVAPGNNVLVVTEVPLS